MGAAPQLPQLDPAQHRWEKSKTSASAVERRAVGCERIVGLKQNNSDGQYDLYLVARTKISDECTASAPTLATLKESLETALLTLRFLHPESACSVSWEDESAPIIHYQSPENEADARQWAQRLVHTMAVPHSAFDVRVSLEKQRHAAGSSPVSAPPLTAYLIADVADEHAPVSDVATIDVLLHMNHMFWDGISSRLFVGDLLREWGRIIDAADQKTVTGTWGDELTNLSPPLLDVLKVDLVNDRDFISARAGECLETLQESTKAFGLPFTTGLAVPRTEICSFTVAESQAIISALKTRLGKGNTITHLAQAAITVAMLEKNPPEGLDDNDIFATQSPVNGRRFLKPEVAEQYYTMCETCAPLRFENLKSLVIQSGDDRASIIQALTEATRQVKTSFEKCLSSPYQQPAGMTVHTLEAFFLAGTPNPFDKVSVPFFISDGINDKYIPREIQSAKSGKSIMTIENFHFLVNQRLPYLALRLESFRDASSMSVCYNDANYTYEQATGFLEHVKKLMLMFAE